MKKIVPSESQFETVDDCSWPCMSSSWAGCPKAARLTLHRDESRYVNLISIFVLKGEAPFLVSLDRDLSRAMATHTLPGD
jgi:hypothetical protein